MVTPEKEKNNRTLEFGSFTGKPIDGNSEWTKQTLINFCDSIEKKHILLTKGKSRKAYLQKIIDSRTSPDYRGHPDAIAKLFNCWKETGRVRGASAGGRPRHMTLDEAQEAVKVTLKTCQTKGSNQYDIEDMKDALAAQMRKKAEADGLDPDSVNTRVCDKTCKTLMTAVVMSESDDINFNTHQSTNKTEARFITEHSVMSHMSNALTVCCTHIKAGSRPPWMKNDCRYKNKEPISDSTAWTLDQMKQLLGTDEIYCAVPDLVMSTDDTTLFAFEGRLEKGKWEWKIVDITQGDRSVHSNFEVGKDPENGAGLRVRLTFTFTASGLFAPLLISVTGTAASVFYSYCLFN